MAIGGTRPDGAPWSLAEDAAIAAMERGARFYIEHPRGHRVDLLIRRGLGGPSLATERDGAARTLLLDLPECRGRVRRPSAPPPAARSG
jgi:hypothetical protein